MKTTKRIGSQKQKQKNRLRALKAWRTMRTQAARVRALAEGRAHVSADDLKHFAEPVLVHRILLNYDGQAENIRVPDLVRDLLDKAPATPAPNQR
jgi:MoxR-like ATPase